ncbi:hypothetical protein GG344DRAFT_64163 [Lentinula edodes]|nr:hypothetical protein GG344DRAFT_64163 [Lentinula edodes]
MLPSLPSHQYSILLNLEADASHSGFVDIHSPPTWNHQADYPVSCHPNRFPNDSFPLCRHSLFFHLEPPGRLPRILPSKSLSERFICSLSTFISLPPGTTRQAVLYLAIQIAPRTIHLLSVDIHSPPTWNRQAGYLVSRQVALYIDDPSERAYQSYGAIQTTSKMLHFLLVDIQLSFHLKPGRRDTKQSDKLELRPKYAPGQCNAAKNNRMSWSPLICKPTGCC